MFQRVALARAYPQSLFDKRMESGLCPLALCLGSPYHTQTVKIPRRKHGRLRLWTSVVLLVLLASVLADPQLLVLNPLSNLTNGTWLVDFATQGQADINVSLPGQLYCANNESSFSNYTCPANSSFVTEVGYGSHILNINFGNASATAEAFYPEPSFSLPEGPANFTEANETNQTESECPLDADCDDNDTCTDDSCLNGTCISLNNTADCDDGLFCTINDTCSGGACSGLPRTCDDGNSSTNDYCDEEARTCETTLLDFNMTLTESGEVGAMFAGGGGTLLNPYLISNCTHLRDMKNYRSSHFALINDIDCSATRTWNGGAGFIPVGNSSGTFTGSLNGRNHTIFNLYINRPTTDRVGLFGYTQCETPTLISNLGMSNVSVTGQDYVGGLAGWAEAGYWDDQAYAANIAYATGTVSGGNNVGGLFGYTQNYDVHNIYFSGNVSGDNDIGGLVGYMDFYSYDGICYSYSVGIVNADTGGGGIQGSDESWYCYILDVFAASKLYGGDVYGVSPYTDTLYDVYWYDWPGDDANDCDCCGACTSEISDLEDLYDTSNMPMSDWSYPPWSHALDGISYPVFPWQVAGITWNWSQKNSTIDKSWSHICMSTSRTANCTLHVGSSNYANRTRGTNICWNATISQGNHTINVTCTGADATTRSSNAWLKPYHPPSAPTVSLTTTDPLTNNTETNLTGSASATDTGRDNITYRYNWYKNGVLNATTLSRSGLVLYLPLNNDTYDYALTNDGTASSASRTTGKVGGAYSFSNGYIDCGGSTTMFPSSAVTVAAWVYTSSTDHDEVVSSRELGGWRLGTGHVSSGCGGFGVRIGGTEYTDAEASSSFPLNRWVFVTGTYDGTTIRYYENAVQKDSSIHAGTITNPSSKKVCVGAESAGSSCLTSDYNWPGSIDEVMIFNRSLTQSDILKLYLGGRWGGKIMNSSQLTAGDVWILGASAGDYYNWSAETNSSPVTITSANTAPSVTLVVLNSSDLNNYTNETLNCYANITDENATITVYYEWYNGSTLALSGSANVSTGAISLVTSLLPGNTTKGESWTCELMPSDGELNGTALNSTALTIVNAPPEITLVSPPDGDTLYRALNATLSIIVSDADSDPMDVVFYNGTNALCTNLSVTGAVNCFWGGLSPAANNTWYVNATDGTDTTRSPDWIFLSNDEPFVMNMRVDSKGASWVYFAWENEPDMTWISLYMSGFAVHVQSLGGNTTSYWNATGLYRDTEYDFQWQVGDSHYAVSDNRGFPVKTTGWVDREADIGYKRLLTVNNVTTDLPYTALNITLTEDNFRYNDSGVWEPAFKHLNWTDGHNIRFYNYGEVTALPYNISYWRVPGDGGTEIQIAPDEHSVTGSWTNPDRMWDEDDSTYGYGIGSYFYNYTVPEYAKNESQFDRYDHSFSWYFTPPPADCFGSKLRFRTDANYTASTLETYCWNYTSGSWAYMDAASASYLYETRMKWVYNCEANILVMPLHFNYNSQEDAPGLDGDYENKLWFYYGDAVGEAYNSTTRENLEAVDYHTDITLGDEQAYALGAPVISNLNESDQTATGITISWDVDRAVDNRLKIADNPWMLNGEWVWYPINVTDNFYHIWSGAERNDTLSTYGDDYMATVWRNCSNSTCSNNDSCVLLDTSTGDNPINITFFSTGTDEYLDWNITVTENKSWERADSHPEFIVSNLETDKVYYYRAYSYGGANQTSYEDGTFTLGSPPAAPQAEVLNYTEDRAASQVTVCGNLTDDNGEDNLVAYFDYWINGSGTSEATSSEILNDAGDTMCRTIDVDYGNVYHYRLVVGNGWGEPYMNDFMAIQDFFAGNPVEDDNDDRDRQYCPRQLYSDYDLNGSDATWLWLEPCYEQRGYWEGSQQEEDWMWVETSVNITGYTNPLTLHLWDGSSWSAQAMIKDPDSDMVYLMLSNLGDNWYTFYVTNSTGDVVLNWTKPGLMHPEQEGRVDTIKYVKFNGTSSEVNYDLLYLTPAGYYNASAYRWCMAQGEDPVDNPMGNVYDCMSVSYWGSDREANVGLELRGTTYDQGQLFRGGVIDGEPYDTGMLSDTLNASRPMTSEDGVQERHCYAFTAYYWDVDKKPSNNITSYYYRYWRTNERMSWYLGYAQDVHYDYNTLFIWQYDPDIRARYWIEQTQASLNGTTGWPGRNGAGLPHIVEDNITVFPGYPYNQSLIAGWISFESDPLNLSGYYGDDVYNFGFMTDGQWTNQQLGLHQQAFVIFNLPDNATLAGLDSDGDSLNDYDELFTYYTNPKHNDTDEGGRTDGEEVAMSKNPNIYSDDFLEIEINLTSPVTNEYISGTYNITWNESEDDGDRFNVTITLINKTDDSESELANISNGTGYYLWDTTLYEDGVYEITIRACDSYNCSENSSSGNFTVDNTYPSIEWSSLTEPDGAHRSQDYIASNVSWTDDNFKNITWEIDYAAAVFGYPVYSYTRLSVEDGTYLYNVTICDMIGRCNTTQTRTITLDNVDPTLAWTWSTNTTSATTQVNVTLLADENVSACNLGIDGVNTTMSGNSTIFYYLWSMSDGNHTLRAYCNDTANNSARTSLAWYELDTSVTIDVIKTANVSSVLPGGAISWNITVNNTCISNLSIEITDTNGQNFTNDTLEPGESYSVNYTTNASLCEDVNNRATVVATNPNTTSTVTASAYVQVLHCGNGVCDCSETCSSCSSDCGRCPTNRGGGGPSGYAWPTTAPSVLPPVNGTGPPGPGSETPPSMGLDTAEPTIGKEVGISITNPDGSPAEGIITVTAPDGSVISMPVVNGVAHLAPDQPGLWTISYTAPNGKTVTMTVDIAAGGGTPTSGSQSTSPPKVKTTVESSYFNIKNLAYIIVPAAIIIVLIVLWLFIRKKRLAVK